MMKKRRKSALRPLPVIPSLIRYAESLAAPDPALHEDDDRKMLLDSSQEPNVSSFRFRAVNDSFTLSVHHLVKRLS
jgi:hypothetical protein